MTVTSSGVVRPLWVCRVSASELTPPVKISKPVCVWSAHALSSWVCR